MMNCNSPKNTYSTFRSLLLLRFYEAIYPKADVSVAKRSSNLHIEPQDLENLGCFSDQTIIKQVKKSTSVAVYHSAIALRLATISPFTALEIADYLVCSLRSSLNLPQQNIEKQPLRKITVTVLKSGMLEFEFSDFAIVQWLQSVLQARQSGLQPSVISKQNSRRLHTGTCSQLFLCQYSHARCCALIRLADPSNVIGEKLETDSSLWLGDDDNLLTRTASDLALLEQLITTVDALEAAPDLMKLAIGLSQTFQCFYRDCRILDVAQTNSLQRVASRLGLVMITQRLLKQLLEIGLGVLAPELL